jgi:hypothetical protein
MKTFLFFEDKIDSKDKKYKTDQMVYPELFMFKDYQCKAREHQDRNYLLDYLQFNKRKRPAGFFISYPVCRNLESILKKSYTPA